MRRALLPWAVPVLMLLGVLVAATNSTLVYALIGIVVSWVVLPFGLAALRRSDRVPQALTSDSSSLPRWMRFGPDNQQPRPGSPPARR